MCRIFLGAVLALWLPMAAGAAEHRPRVYLNSSLTILSIAEGPDGSLPTAAWRTAELLLPRRMSILTIRASLKKPG